MALPGVSDREVGLVENMLGRRRSGGTASPSPAECGLSSSSGLTPPQTGSGAYLPAPCNRSHSIHLTGTIVAAPVHVPKRLFCVLIASAARLGFVSWSQVS